MHTIKCLKKACTTALTNKLYADIENYCQSYFICDNAELKYQQCNGELLFNPITLHCDWPQNVRCPANGVTTTTPDNGNGGGGGGGGDNCPPEKPCPPCPITTPCPCPDTTTCTTTTVTTTTSTPAIIITTTCTCPPVETPCPTPAPCPPVEPPPPGPQPPSCPGNGPCVPGTGPGTGNSMCKGIKTGTLIPNYSDGCKTYYVCDNDETKQLDCGFGLLFNPLKQYCDWSNAVTCRMP